MEHQEVYTVELYARVRRAVIGDQMSEREACGILNLPLLALQMSAFLVILRYCGLADHPPPSMRCQIHSL